MNAQTGFNGPQLGLNQHTAPSDVRVKIFAAASSWRTADEIVENLAGKHGISTTNSAVRHHLRALEKAGQIEREKIGTSTVYRNNFEDMYAEKWKEACRKEGHRRKRPTTGPNQNACPHVAERRRQIARFVQSHNGVSAAEINAEIYGVNTNDFGQLRAHGLIHAKRVKGAPRATLYFAGPGPEVGQ